MKLKGIEDEDEDEEEDEKEIKIKIKLTIKLTIKITIKKRITIIVSPNARLLHQIGKEHYALVQCE